MENNLKCPHCDSSNLRMYFDPDNNMCGESHYECLDCHEDGMTEDELIEEEGEAQDETC